jgi:ribonuclease P protein subunit POP4
MEKAKHPALELLSRAQGDLAQTVFTDAVLHKPLVIRPTTSADQSSDARSARQRARAARAAESALRNRKPKPLSAKEKRELGLYHIPESQQDFQLFEPLHRLWLAYIRDVLASRGRNLETAFADAKGAGPLLAAADMHGAVVTVVRCRCVGRVGLTGLIAKETKYTFEVITRQNTLKGKKFAIKIDASTNS